ncbi:MAG: NAD-binding protein [Thermoflavifilum sp.]|nr:NAD-binding protein [Thermoflavifilum sp.]MCL6514176.1 NAD-binding protein [Alicyclobacillus sp.]
MSRILVAAFGEQGQLYVHGIRQLGAQVRVLDCFEEYHAQLCRWYGTDVLQVQGRRVDVRRAVARERFDAAVVQESPDFIRSALITQSLREANVPRILVVTGDPEHAPMFRRCGAHQVFLARNPEEGWRAVAGHLPVIASA